MLCSSSSSSIVCQIKFVSSSRQQILVTQYTRATSSDIRSMHLCTMISIFFPPAIIILFFLLCRSFSVKRSNVHSLKVFKSVRAFVCNVRGRQEREKKLNLKRLKMGDLEWLNGFQCLDKFCIVLLRLGKSSLNYSLLFFLSSPTWAPCIVSVKTFTIAWNFTHCSFEKTQKYGQLISLSRFKNFNLSALTEPTTIRTKLFMADICQFEITICSVK